MAAIRNLITVYGLVQGVGFRLATRSEATRLGLRGWVRNELDGRVAIDVEGDAAAVAEFREWCRRGPRGARVTDMSCEEAPLKGYQDFEITY